jgi:glycosyltransferase involved in cell wall biosynthesis
VDFGGGSDFFARDSGLLCRGFQALGMASRAVMPGAVRPDDEPDVLRVDAEKLRSAEWWASLGIDALVLYAWGSPRFLPVARAIREAGIFLVLNQDNGGLVSPSIDLKAWLREQAVLTGAGRLPGGWWSAAVRVAKGLTSGLLLGDRLRARHLSQGDVIACVSPVAAEHHRTFCRRHGGEELARKVAVVPHAVDPRYRPDANAVREVAVAAVGRWSDLAQKRQDRLMEVAERLLAREPGVVLHIVGGTTDALRSWHEALDPALRSRIHLRGRLDPADLAALWSRVQVGWCPSAFESFHIASAEALCCGASVVASDSPSLSSFRWFTAEGDGRLAASDDPQGHVDAIVAELAAWRDGRRSAEEISRRWSARLHAPAVAGMLVSMMKNDA